MTEGRAWFPVTVAAFGEDGPAGAAGPAIAGFQPVASRWTWQPRLPELWLRVQEGLHFRMVIEQQKKEA